MPSLSHVWGARDHTKMGKKLTHRVNLSLNLGFVVSSVIYFVLKFFRLKQFAALGGIWEGMGLGLWKGGKGSKVGCKGWDPLGHTPFIRVR